MGQQAGGDLLLCRGSRSLASLVRGPRARTSERRSATSEASAGTAPQNPSEPRRGSERDSGIRTCTVARIGARGSERFWATSQRCSRTSPRSPGIPRAQALWTPSNFRGRPALKSEGWGDRLRGLRREIMKKRLGLEHGYEFHPKPQHCSQLSRLSNKCLVGIGFCHPVPCQ